MMTTSIEKYEAAEAAFQAAQSAHDAIKTRRLAHAARVADAAKVLADATEALANLTVQEALGEASPEALKTARKRRDNAGSDHAVLSAANHEFDRRVAEAQRKASEAEAALTVARKQLASEALTIASDDARTAARAFYVAQRRYLEIIQILGWPGQGDSPANRNVIAHGDLGRNAPDTLKAIATAAGVDWQTHGFAHGTVAKASVADLRALLSKKD